MKMLIFVFWIAIGGGTIGASIYMSCNNLPNWGWFLFAGVAILASATLNDRVTIINKDDDEA